MAIDTDLFVAEGKPRRRLVHHVTLHATPEEIFDTLTTSEGVRFFNGIESNIELRIGGAYEWLFDPEAPEGRRGGEGCQILAYLPPSMLAFSWNAPPHLEEPRGKRTWVVVTLVALEAGTALELSHLGFGEGDAWDACFAYFDAAWPRVLDALESRFGPA